MALSIVHNRSIADTGERVSFCLCHVSFSLSIFGEVRCCQWISLYSNYIIVYKQLHIMPADDLRPSLAPHSVLNSNCWYCATTTATAMRSVAVLLSVQPSKLSSKRTHKSTSVFCREKNKDIFFILINRQQPDHLGTLHHNTILCYS